METLREKLEESNYWHKLRSMVLVEGNRMVYKCWCEWRSEPVESGDTGGAFIGHQVDMQMAVVAEHIAPQQENEPAWLSTEGASGYSSGIGYVLTELESDL